MRFDRDKFYAAYRLAFPSRLSQSQVSGLNTLLSFIESDLTLTDIRHVAYMLATVKHECADTWQPIVERGAKAYFWKYDPHTKLGSRLGNVIIGDGYRYRGRGYVQITGRANYRRLTDVLSKAIDWVPVNYLVNLPDKALEPEIAYQIMSVGMRNGLFTGKKLNDYINDEGCDYRNARRTINGLDRAELIAGYAQSIEKVLRSSITGEC